MKHFHDEYEQWLYEGTERHKARFKDLKMELAQAIKANDENKIHIIKQEISDLASELDLIMRDGGKSDRLFSFITFTWLIVYAAGFVAVLVIVLITLFLNIINLYSQGKFDKVLDFLFLTFLGKIALTFTVSVVGYTLFLFKKKKQFYYGLLETSFAIANCYILADNFQKTLARHNDIANILFSGMATLYLMVRGLSNISDGIGKSRSESKMLVRKTEPDLDQIL